MIDQDLSFLSECNNDQLLLLCDLVVFDPKDSKKRLTETLSTTREYQVNYPNNIHDLLPLLIKEIQTFGGNTIANFFRGEGIKYSKIVKDVASQLKVSYNAANSVELIEQYILQKVLITSVEKMSKEDLNHIKANLSKEQLKNQIYKLKTGSPLLIKMAGIMVLQLSKKYAQNAALGYLAKWAGSKAFTNWAGPIGWALTALWTLYDISGPAYRVTVPVVITIAYLRQVYSKSEDEMNEIFS